MYQFVHTIEQVYFQQITRQQQQKLAGSETMKLNVDWPSMKQLEDGTWPPVSPNWFNQQEALTKLWPNGMSGFAEVFSSITALPGGGSQAQQSAQKTEQKEEVKEEKEQEKEQQNFDLELLGFDAAQKIKIIKEVRTILGLGLKEAKELVEKTPPNVIKKGLKKVEAEDLIKKFEALGCKVKLV